MNRSLATLLETLCEREIRFILVGGLAAVAQGVPVTTFDVDIVPALEETNLEKLHRVLMDLDTHFRGRSEDRRLAPTLDDLRAGGHCLLMTSLGPLDVLGKIEQGHDYFALLEDSIAIPFKSHSLRVLKLEAIIEHKSHSRREKDQLKVRLYKEALSKTRGK